MIGWLLAWFGGYAEVLCAGERAARMWETIRRHGFTHWRIRRGEDGSLSLRMREKDARALTSICSAEGAGIRITAVYGLPRILERLRGRWGIPLGVLLFSLTVYASTRVVWEIRVVGNDDVPESEIVRLLADCGFGVGSRCRGTDCDVLQNEVLRRTDSLAWIAVNIQGTVAHVEVRERGMTPEPEADGVANVVAAEDAQIVELRVRGGRAEVSAGDTVRAGELLIGGILTIGENGLRFERADGTVLAQVRREISVTVPAVREEDVCMREENGGLTLIFFGKEIKLCKNSGIEEGRYDTIIRERSLTLPDGRALPVSLRRETRRITGTVTTVLSEAEAEREAESALRRQMETLLADGEILEITLERDWDESAYRIEGQAVCLCDIARAVPVRVPRQAPGSS